jgi:hypothetical protein
MDKEIVKKAIDNHYNYNNEPELFDKNIDIDEILNLDYYFYNIDEYNNEILLVLDVDNNKMYLFNKDY